MELDKKQQKAANDRRWYLNNIDRHKEKKKDRKIEMLTWFKDYKKGLTCNECDETHPACLEFHHRNPKEKVFQITKAVHDGFSKETILNEISKCDVLCANCHRKLHHSLTSYFKVSGR